MVTEIREKAPTAQKLFTITQARQVLIDLGVCSAEDVDERIRASRKENAIFIHNDIFAAFVLADVTSTIEPVVKSNFEKIYGVPYSTEALIDQAFGGFKIDPKQANLPNTK